MDADFGPVLPRLREPTGKFYVEAGCPGATLGDYWRWSSGVRTISRRPPVPRSRSRVQRTPFHSNSLPAYYAEMDTVTAPQPRAPRDESQRTSNKRDYNASRAAIDSGELTGSHMFEEVSTRAILGQVPPKLQREEERSLWRRIQSEFESGGPRAVTSYLRSQFDEITTSLGTELTAAEDAE